jgi:hypothetical protein
MAGITTFESLFGQGVGWGLKMVEGVSFGIQLDMLGLVGGHCCR